MSISISGSKYAAMYGPTVGDTKAAGNVYEHVLLHQLEAHALLQNGKQHVQTALVEACGRALRGAIGC